MVEKGIAAGHSPMIGRLGYGELRLKSGGSVERYYVDGRIRPGRRQCRLADDGQDLASI